MKELTPEKKTRRRHRFKYATTLLNTYGHGLAGAGLVTTFLDGKGTLAAAIAFLLGLACHGVALYIVPEGEPA